MSGYREMVTRDEPMKKWENFHEENLLQLFYDDPARWAFVFQTQVLITLG